MSKLTCAALSVLSVLALSTSAMAQPNLGHVVGPRAQVLAPERGAPQPRYVVTAVRIHANDETGRDWLGSDEIYVVFGDPAQHKYGHSSIFGDFDTGETRNFTPNQWCLTPITEPIYRQGGDLIGWQCLSTGIGGPFSFSLAVYESDSSWTPSACLPDSLPSGVQCQDDLVGSRTISYSRAELTAAMPRIGDTVTESARMGGYTVTWRVQRIADSGTPPVIQ